MSLELVSHLDDCGSARWITEALRTHNQFPSATDTHYTEATVVASHHQMFAVLSQGKVVDTGCQKAGVLFFASLLDLLVQIQRKCTARWCAAVKDLEKERLQMKISLS